MKKNLKGKITLLLLCALLPAVLGGCDLFTQLTLTEEQSELVAEYAAGLLRKYDRNVLSVKNMTDEEIWAEPEPLPTAEPEPEPEPLPEPESEGMEMSVEDASQDANPEESVTEEYSSASLAEAMGTPGFDIRYASYELCDRYPEQEDNSWLISMAASEGKTLLVIHFTISNLSDTDQICDVLGANRTYRLSINGGSPINEHYSLLMNSLSQYNAAVAADGEDDAVLIFEVEKELAESVGSMDLIVKDGELSERFMLF